MQDIADGEGDVDTFIAHETARRSPPRAAAIASRLLAAGRADEALAFLKKGAPAEPSARDLEDEWAFALEGTGTSDWERAWVEALLATGRQEEAQRFRWARFEARLDAAHLRAYLKALPDFEDVVAERKALDHALGFPHFAIALSFFIEWKELRYAARLVLERSRRDRRQPLLRPRSRRQGARGQEQPLAAALLRRAMIEDTLEGAKATRYRHAARHLLECRALERRHQRPRRVRDARRLPGPAAGAAWPQDRLLESSGGARWRSRPAVIGSPRRKMASQVFARCVAASCAPCAACNASGSRPRRSCSPPSAGDRCWVARSPAPTLLLAAVSPGTMLPTLHGALPGAPYKRPLLV